ncbi:MAG: prolipoprotein diacylglyceryl transferase [Metamycoplasmataceae bacterium]|uniref:prolipoprotein diacylglyceryl transferase n=1 Tax=Mycoplasmopsis lipophila TaxID=2117 RepID=UPI00387345B5
MHKPSWTPEAPIKSGEQTPLFYIGKLPIQTYSLMLMFGMLAAIITIYIFWKREKYKIEILMGLIIITIPMALFGARLGYIIEALIYDPGTITWKNWYKSWEGGLSIQGGILLAMVCDLGYVYSKRKYVDIRKVSSIIIPTILIGQVVGRWGNYANHEVYGKIDWTGRSSLIFGKFFASNMYITDSLSQSLGLEGAYRYPLFLYEGIANLIGYILIVWVINWLGLLKPGASVGLYFLWYGLLRYFMEPLRQESFKLYVVISIIFIMIGTFALIRYQFLNSVHYIRAWRNGRYVYQYAHPEKYYAYVERTKFSNLFKFVEKTPKTPKTI